MVQRGYLRNIFIYFLIPSTGIIEVHKICGIGINFHGELVPAKIAFAKGHVYRPKEYVRFVAAVKHVIQRNVRGIRFPIDAFYRIEMDICLKKRPRGGKVGDIDNFVKPIMDAGTGLIYADDHKVVSIRAELQRNAKEDGFHAVYIPLELINGRYKNIIIDIDECHQ